MSFILLQYHKITFYPVVVTIIVNSVIIMLVVPAWGTICYNYVRNLILSSLSP